MHNEWQSVKPGEVQVMSAGTGLSHSEINGSNDEYLSLFQIWIMPDKENVEPRYDQKYFEVTDRKNILQKLVTSIDEDHIGSLKIHQKAILSRIDLDKNRSFEYKLKSRGHGVYVMNIHGKISIENENIEARDAVGISDTLDFSIHTQEDSELLIIEVPLVQATYN